MAEIDPVIAEKIAKMRQDSDYVSTKAKGEEVRQAISNSIDSSADAIEAAIRNQILQIDDTLTESGQGAEAKTVGDSFSREYKIVSKKVVNNGYTNSKYDKISITDMNGKIGAQFDYGFIGDANVRSNWYSANYDFAVCDKVGNVVCAIKNGELVINNGSHSNKLKGKKFSVIGDSISTFNGYNPTGYATYYPQGDVNSANKTWWKQLEQSTGMVLLKNASWAGSGVTGNSTDSTGKCASSDARIAAIADGETIPDIIIIYITTNDWKMLESEIGEFDSTMDLPEDGTQEAIAPAYALMLSKLRTAYPNAEIYCCLNLEGRPAEGDADYPYLNSNGESIHQVNHAIAEIAHIFGAKVVDLETCGVTYWNVSSYTVDQLTTHPNAAGMAVIAETIKKELLK